MNKIGKMSATIEDLRSAATAISGAADWLTELFSGEEPEQETVSAEPLLTEDAVRAVLTEKSRAGFTDQIRSLLRKYGSDKLSGIDTVNYEALLADVEGLKNAT